MARKLEGACPSLPGLYTLSHLLMSVVTPGVCSIAYWLVEGKPGWWNRGRLIRPAISLRSQFLQGQKYYATRCPLLSSF